MDGRKLKQQDMFLWKLRTLFFFLVFLDGHKLNQQDLFVFLVCVFFGEIRK